MNVPWEKFEFNARELDQSNATWAVERTGLADADLQVRRFEGIRCTKYLVYPYETLGDEDVLDLLVAPFGAASGSMREADETMKRLVRSNTRLYQMFDQEGARQQAPVRIGDLGDNLHNILDILENGPFLGWSSNQATFYDHEALDGYFQDTCSSLPLDEVSDLFRFGDLEPLPVKRWRRLAQKDYEAQIRDRLDGLKTHEREGILNNFIARYFYRLDPADDTSFIRKQDMPGGAHPNDANEIKIERSLDPDNNIGTVYVRSVDVPNRGRPLLEWEHTFEGERNLIMRYPEPERPPVFDAQTDSIMHQDYVLGAVMLANFVAGREEKRIVITEEDGVEKIEEVTEYPIRDELGSYAPKRSVSFRGGLLPVVAVHKAPVMLGEPFIKSIEDRVAPKNK